MPTYRISATVTGGKYIAEIQAASAQEALELGWEHENCCSSMCHQCSSDCEDPEITDLYAYNVDDEDDEADTTSEAGP